MSQVQNISKLIALVTFQVFCYFIKQALSAEMHPKLNPVKSYIWNLMLSFPLSNKESLWKFPGAPAYQSPQSLQQTTPIIAFVFNNDKIESSHSKGRHLLKFNGPF